MKYRIGNMYFGYDSSPSFGHYGIPGMSWGKRRFQNEDGSLTPLGERRYGYDSQTKTGPAAPNSIRSVYGGRYANAAGVSGSNYSNPKPNSANLPGTGRVASATAYDRYGQGKVPERRQLTSYIDQRTPALYRYTSRNGDVQSLGGRSLSGHGTVDQQQKQPLASNQAPGVPSNSDYSDNDPLHLSYRGVKSTVSPNLQRIHGFNYPVEYRPVDIDVDKAVRESSAAARSVLSGVKQNSKSNLGRDIVSRANAYGMQVGNAAQNAWNSAQGAVANAGQMIGDAAQNAWNAAQGMAADVAQSMQAGYDAVTQWANGVGSKTMELWDRQYGNASRAIQDGYEMMSSFFGNLFGRR